MPTRRTFERFANLPRRALYFLYAVAGLATVISFIVGTWFGGRAAIVTGQIQFITVVMVVFVAVIIILFSSYGPRVNAVLSSWPVAFVRVIVANVFGLLCGYAIAVTVWAIAGGR
jgi:hypothetical protein